jgi:collagenase-like PrtC family protease
MHLSVAYSFQPGLIEQLARFPQVREVYAKQDKDLIGGGRSSYTLRPVSRSCIARAVRTAKRHGIGFNYLLNGATLNGMEHTRKGQRAIRAQLDRLVGWGVSSVTVATPYLLRLVKAVYPSLSVRVGVFALVDNAHKARQWEDMGADTICVSAIACNRDRHRLKTIRDAVSCELQLIVNASCMLHCSHELTHMHMLTNSSRRGDPLHGFCMDYCFLHCSSARLRDPTHYIRATWIRPEDLHLYEELGYHSFKIVERSSPAAAIVQRVRAYSRRCWDGNLLDIAGPTAQIDRRCGQRSGQLLRMLKTMCRPDMIKISRMLQMKRYAALVLSNTRPGCGDRARRDGVYIDNSSLQGLCRQVLARTCDTRECHACGLCERYAARAVTINEDFKHTALSLADSLDTGLVDGSLWW